MIAVSNTTPLRYLIAIEQEQLFPKLFEKVFVPQEVHEELTKTRTPERVRKLVQTFPSWYEVRGVHDVLSVVLPAMLHPGEREAILLAESIKPDFLLIDEQVGRMVALERKLPGIRNARSPGARGCIGSFRELSRITEQTEGERILYIERARKRNFVAPQQPPQVLVSE